jgi:predicted TIM-barrel fold metal-dependent hydrolase
MRGQKTGRAALISPRQGRRSAIVISPAELVAIDVHTHAEISAREPIDELYAERSKAMAEYFKGATHRPTVPQVAAYYRARKIACVIFPVDSERASGEKRVSNEEVAELAAQNSDIMIPFASIDPAKGRMGAREARRLIRDFGVKGFKFHPSMQGFFPNDRSAYVLYEAIAEAGLPALFHTGQTGVGANMRGGGGIRLKYSHPMYLDDVAVDFPDMPIIMAHPSFPWQEEALSVATHKPQVYIDLSGWSPKYFPPILVQYANSLLKHKMLFGSDYPLITPDRWLADFENIPIKSEVRPLILKENAAKLLKLDGKAA